MAEKLKAIQRVKTDRVAGVGGIPPEVWEDGGQAFHAKFHEVVCYWRKGEPPPDLHNESYHPVQGRRKIRLLKLLRYPPCFQLLEKSLQEYFRTDWCPLYQEKFYQKVLPENQCGFKANRSTTDMVFVFPTTARKMQGTEGKYITFLDPTIVFDTMSGKVLWQILEQLGCPPKFLKMIMLLHENQRGKVKYGDALSEPFPIINGMKQDCVSCTNSLHNST
uniref:Reverse transcriptase domain-containing protein n=1 Tax=Loa loa TaxID=7209 RepID=A0A1I7VDW2_LOALO